MPCAVRRASGISEGFIQTGLVSEPTPGATSQPDPCSLPQETIMYQSPSHLPPEARAKLADLLNARLADGLDLHSQIKVAHWNIKGPQFAALHPLFETFAVGLAAYNDEIAERAVTLGARAFGTVRHVAKASKLPEYPQDTSRDLDHVQLLAERIEHYLA